MPGVAPVRRQAARWPSRSRSGGSRRRHRRRRSGQRGAKRQPGIAAAARRPGMRSGTRYSARRGRSSAGWQAAGSAYRDAPASASTARAGPRLDGAAGVQHQDLVADLRGEPQIVGDEHHRGAVRSLHLGDQLHDARLDGDVERGGRLVGDRPGAARWRTPWRSARAGTCRRKADADSAPAARRRRGRCTASSMRQRAVAPLLAAAHAEARQMLVELRADGQHRVERRQRLLRDEGDVAAEQRAARAPAACVTRSAPSNTQRARR